MSLFDEIQNDLIHEPDLSKILRRAKILAYKLGNDSFKQWVENEINGYDNDDPLPKYRILSVASMADLLVGNYVANNQSIPLLLIPAEIRNHFEKLEMFQGIKELESLMAQAQTSGGFLKMQIRAELYQFVHGKIYLNSQCIRAWRLLNSGKIEQIIETTKTNLLSFILELAEQYPELKEDSYSNGNISNEEIGQVFNNCIFEGISYIGNATNLKIRGGDMSTFDQRNQNVNTQYNAAGNMNFEDTQLFEEKIDKLIALVETSSLNTVQKIQTKSDIQAIKELASVEKSPEVVESAHSKIEAVENSFKMTSDMASLGMISLDFMKKKFEK